MKRQQCGVKEKCNRKIRYQVTDLRQNKHIELCEAHFKQGMRAWLEPNSLIGGIPKDKLRFVLEPTIRGRINILYQVLFKKRVVIGRPFFNYFWNGKKI